MEIKDYTLKLKSGIDDTGRFTGFAAIYGEVDLQGDVIEKSAFKRAISQQGGGFPLLAAHRQETPIGIASLEDSERGPLVHGAIDLQDPDGAVWYRRVKNGLVRGLSIGFSVANPDTIAYIGGVRHIKELRLHEISLVSVPAQPGALITSVKSLADAVRVIDSLPADLDERMMRELRGLQAAIQKRMGMDTSQAIDTALLADLKALALDLRRSA